MASEPPFQQEISQSIRRGIFMAMIEPEQIQKNQALGVVWLSSVRAIVLKLCEHI